MLNKICKWLHELRPMLLMVVVQFLNAGLNVVYKLVVYDGMSVKIIVAYRCIFATAFLTPFALIFERKKRPKLTKTILFQAFISGLFGGSLSQNLYTQSLVLTSSTFATAMTNLIPAVTFVLAIFFRLEKTGITTAAGKAIVVGTLLGIGGAMLLTFYKGAEINIWSMHFNLMKVVTPHGGHVASLNGTQILGFLYALGNCFSISLWLINQAKMSAKYPCPYSTSALTSAMAAFQSTVFASCFERDWTQWKLGWNIRLFSVAYAGIIVHGIMMTLVIWCLSIKGPLFTSNFNPLMLLFTTLAGSLLLDEQLYVGSLLGAVLMVCGLYAILWGKDKEMKMSQLILSKKSKEMETMQSINSTSNNDANGESSNGGMIVKNIHGKEEVGSNTEKKMEEV